MKNFIFKQVKLIFIIQILIFCLNSNLISMENSNEGVVTYAYRNNGKELKDYSLKIFYKNGIVSYHSSRQQNKKNKESRFINYNTEQTYQLLRSSDSEKYIVKKSFSDYEQSSITDEIETILGHVCKKAVLKIRSNTIEVWFTKNLNIKGSPRISIAPNLGLILKVIRNKSYEVYATSIDFREVSEDELKFNIQGAKEVNAETYQRQVIDSRYQTIKVFDTQIINFDPEIETPDNDQANITYRYSKGTTILKKITLPEFKGGMTAIAEVVAWSNGDAYDRSGSLFIIPVEKEISFMDAFTKDIKAVPMYKDNNGKEFQGVVATENYEPPLELMRFFTPFGVRHFNDNVKIKGYNWADSVLYRQDISELIPNKSGEVWIGIFIGNYDKGGHKASLTLKFYPAYSEQESPRKWTKSIFNTMNIMEMSGQNYGTMFHQDSLEVTVNIPEGLESLTLRYTSTGHGGWGGGDEFNPKLNELFIDDELVYAFIPWRSDCATYRLYNPSSGNFGNGLSSSDLSRSNWCPGSLTVPENIVLNDITPGLHTFKVAIPIGKREGNSFSAWNVSGTLIGIFPAIP